MNHDIHIDIDNDTIVPDHDALTDVSATSSFDTILKEFVVLNRNLVKQGLENKNQFMFDVSMGDLEQYMSRPLPSMHGLDMNVHLKCFIHELRTPISTIASGLELLANSTEPPSPEQTTEIILDSLQTIQFIEDILTKFSVIQDDNLVLNSFEPFLFSTLFDEIQRLMRYQINDTRDLEFTMEIEPSILHQWYLGDKHNIQHVIINLIKNAIKYRDKLQKSTISLYVTLSPHCEHKVNVRPLDVSRTLLPHPPSTTTIHSNKKEKSSSLKRRNSLQTPRRQRIMISICDTNPHLLPHIKQKLFQIFNSTSGSGLGLYICKNIVELHGGTIYHDFLEQEYCGNRFTIQLELELSDDLCPKSIKPQYGNALKPVVILSSITHTFSDLEHAQKWSLPNQKKGSKYNVLIVDDSMLNRKLMYRTLKQMDIFNDVFTAEDGQDAVHKVCNYGDNIDVILMDKSMPIMDGYEAVTYMRSMLHYEGLIIGLTGYDDATKINEFVQRGANHVLIKPLNKKYLVEYILKFYTDR